MNLPQQIAKHFRDVHFGGNWTCVSLKDTLADVGWEEATTKVRDTNSILTLTYHMYYYLELLLKVLQGGPLDGKDEYSFNHPDVTCKEDWDNLLNKYWADAEKFTVLVAELPEDIFSQTFKDEKYGTYYRNIAGIIEHTHYHMGQIVIIKKMLRSAYPAY